MSAFETEEFIFEILRNQYVRLKECKHVQNICSIPSSVSYQSKEFKILEIGNKAFFECQQLKMIKIPHNVEKIGDYCFSQSSLENIEIENSSLLKAFGISAFSECQQL